MRKIRFIADKTNFPFLKWRKPFFIISGALIIASFALLGGKGLNFGIDFSGGIVIEVETQNAINLTEMRNILSDVDIGTVELQEFGANNHALIRIERQSGDGQAQQAAILLVKEALSNFSQEITYRRTESVGPKVGSELIQAGVIAIVLAIIMMLAYIWFRFEFPFAVGAVVALLHDVALTVGMLSLTGFEVNLASLAAVLLIVGYSMNDTVVVYDRVRENLRKYKTKPLLELLNQSVNETLSRTVITSGTTLLALLALFIFGGEVIRGFSFTMIWGVIAGTYSSVFVAGALLLYVKPQRGNKIASSDKYAGAERLQAEVDSEEVNEVIDSTSDSMHPSITETNQNVFSTNNSDDGMKTSQPSRKKKRRRRKKRK